MCCIRHLTCIQVSCLIHRIGNDIFPSVVHTQTGSDNRGVIRDLTHSRFRVRTSSQTYTDIIQIADRRCTVTATESDITSRTLVLIQRNLIRIMLMRTCTGTCGTRDRVKYNERTQIRRVIHNTYNETISGRSSHLIIEGQNQGLEVFVRTIQLVHRSPCRSLVARCGARIVRIDLQAVDTLRRILIGRSSFLCICGRVSTCCRSVRTDIRNIT